MKWYIALTLLISLCILQPLWVSASLSQADIRLSNIIEWLRDEWVVSIVRQEDDPTSYHHVFYPPKKNLELYRVSDTITRREALKVGLLSYIRKDMYTPASLDIPDTCLWLFEDMKADDWGCKYAEYALKHDIIAHNTHFRPDDSITHIEALKILMLMHGYHRDKSQNNWQQGYIQAAKDIFILDEWNNQNNQDILRWEMFLYIHNIWGYNNLQSYTERSSEDIIIVRDIDETLTAKIEHTSLTEIEILPLPDISWATDYLRIIFPQLLQKVPSESIRDIFFIKNIDEIESLLDYAIENSLYSSYGFPRTYISTELKEDILVAMKDFDFENYTLFFELTEMWSSSGGNASKKLYKILESEDKYDFIVRHLTWWDGWYWMNFTDDFVYFYQFWIFPKSDKEIRFTHYLEPRYLIVE